MVLRSALTRLRATAVFSAVGAATGTLLVVLAVLLALLSGDSVRLDEIASTLGIAVAVGGTAGGLFAVALPVLQRLVPRRRLTYPKAILGGAVATVLAPALVGYLFLNPTGLSIVEVITSLATDSWGLMGFGGAMGAGLNTVARQAQLGPYEEPESLCPGASPPPLGEREVHSQ